MEWDKEKVAQSIVQSLKRGVNVLFTAPTGWGKTSLIPRIISELRDFYKAFVVLTPTLTLAVEKVFPLVASSHEGVILTAGATTPGMCARGYRRYPQLFCRRCPLEKHYKIETPRVLTYKDIIESLEEKYCPYWTQRNVETRYNIRIGHFGRAKNLTTPGSLVIIDEFHEYLMPSIVAFDLAQLGLHAVADVAVLKELVASRVDPENPQEDLVYLLKLVEAPAAWIEDGILYAAFLNDLDVDAQILGLTATPPPSWIQNPPPGWDVIKVDAPRRRARLLGDICLYYRVVKYTDVDYLKSLCREVEPVLLHTDAFGAAFAPATIRDYIKYTCLGDLANRGLIDLFDSWGRYRVGVDLDYDIVIVFWPSLHVSVRRMIRSRGVDPDVIELTNAVQLAGRARRAQYIFFVDCRYKRHREYLSHFYELSE